MVRSHWALANCNLPVSWDVANNVERVFTRNEIEPDILVRKSDWNYLLVFLISVRRWFVCTEILFCKTGMHSSRMRTDRLLTVGGEGVCLGGSASLGGPPSPAVNRMTHRCKNITLPQTSFAGGSIIGPNFGDGVNLVTCKHSFNSHTKEKFRFHIWSV